MDTFSCREALVYSLSKVLADCWFPEWYLSKWPDITNLYELFLWNKAGWYENGLKHLHYLFWPWFKINKNWRKNYIGLISELDWKRSTPLAACCPGSLLPIRGHRCLGTNRRPSAGDLQNSVNSGFSPPSVFVSRVKDLILLSHGSFFQTAPTGVHLELIWINGKTEAQIHFFPIVPSSSVLTCICVIGCTRHDVQADV